jgi:WD40 repeat protein
MENTSAEDQILFVGFN